MNHQTEAIEPANIQAKAYQCRHLFTDGRRCGSRALRGEPFCYYHHTARHPAPRKPFSHCGQHSEFELLLPEDRSAIQHNIGEVLRRIATNQIDLKRAGLLLYGLQIASINLPREARPSTHQTPSSRHRSPLYSRIRSPYDDQDTPDQDTALNNQPLEEVIFDETLGPIAPLTEFTSPANNHQPGPAQLLLEKLQRATRGEPQLTPQPTQIPTLQATADETSKRSPTDPISKPPIRGAPAFVFNQTERSDVPWNQCKKTASWAFWPAL